MARLFLSRRSLILSCFLFLVVLTTAAQRSVAVDLFWVGGTGAWDNDPNNWSLTLGGAGGAGVPGPTDNARLIHAGSDNIVVTYQPGNAAVDFMPVDATGTGTITFSLPSGDLVARAQQSGRDGRGIFNQSGGTNTLTGGGNSSVLVLGRNVGAQGEYNLSGGTLSAFGGVVGFMGAGTFNQTGGTNTATNSLQIAATASGQGVYNLSGAGSSLTSSETFVGAFGQGSFVQSGGTQTVDNATGGSGSLTLGFAGGSRGTYALSGGDLNVKGNAFVGVVGQGVFTQTGGVLTVGTGASGTGDLNLGFAFNFGLDADRSGIYNLNGGTLDVKDDSFIGMDGVGLFTQTQGIHSIADRLVLGSLTTASVAGTPADLIGVGVYNLTGGDLGSATGEIGELGIGTFNQTGGTYTVAGALLLGKETGGVGTYNLNNGDLSAGSIVVGSAGVGTFNQTGGTNTVGSVSVAATTSAVGTFNLRSGDLLVTGEVSNAGSFNYTGGSLTAGSIVNDGTFVVGGGGFRVIDSGFTNNAIVKTVEGTTPVYTGPFTNNGLVVNDPVFLGDVSNTADGFFTEAAGGEDFIFGRNFKNESRRNVEWKTANSLLAFVDSVDLGGGVVFNTQLGHDLYLPGIDMGAVLAGFVDNFAWESLSLASGNTLTLLDGNTDQAGGALYIQRLLLADELAQIGSITGNGLNIYYLPGLADNAYLGGQTFNLLGGGQIIPIPEPATAMLIAGGFLLCLSGRGARRGR